jgi:diguanylate cyclase (GGDEF)-like protein
VTTRPERRTGGQDFQATANQVLRHLHAAVGLDVWAVGRRQGEDWVVLSSAGQDIDGLQVPWADTLCARVNEGKALWATPDVDQVEALVEARDLIGLPIRAFVTVPLVDADGEIMGTVCGASLTVPAEPSLLDCEDEVRVMGQVLGALLSAELRLEREARHREVAEQDAQTDSLTGLGNRRRWDRQLAAEEERCRRYGSTAAIITVDVDDMKVVNDRWGHDAGDTLLRQLATVLRRECRPGDVVARVGGDEFAVLLAEAGATEAAHVAERLRSAISAADLAASLGVAVRGREGLNGAWRDADAHMYDVKRRQTRREPVRPENDRSGMATTGKEAVIQELLSLARRHTGADISFLGRVEGTNRVLRGVQSANPLPVGPGHADPLENTYCQRILSGELPAAIPDTSLNPVALALPITQQFAIGSYLGVPVTLTDGRLYGTLCCLSHEANEVFDASAVRFLESLASSLSHVLQDEETERAGRRTALASIDEVLERRSFGMLFQPVVDLATGCVRAAEALARFHDTDRTTAQWFADATRVDRGSELELAAIKMGLDESSSWAGHVWLNLSASVLVSPAASGLFAGRDLSRVTVEVSEHEEVDDYTSLRKALAPWRDEGLQIAVDDVGAGFSSLRHVLELAPDVVKLDISLVQGLPTDPVRRALVTALVAFATEAGAVVVAEGIETEAELQALRGTGVTLGQGFHLARPMLVDELPDRVAVGVLPHPRASQTPRRIRAL